jgi:hypothetical protein
MDRLKPDPSVNPQTFPAVSHKDTDFDKFIPGDTEVKCIKTVSNFILEESWHANTFLDFQWFTKVHVIPTHMHMQIRKTRIMLSVLSVCSSQ